jgi:hypothetical protein
MSKVLLFIAILVVALLQSASASNVRRRAGGGGGRAATKGLKGGLKRMVEHSARDLKGYYPHGYEAYYPPGYEEHAHHYSKTSKSSKSKGKSRGGRKKARPKCRPVVEGAEFIVEGAITNVMANMTDDNSMIGTEFIYNGPLLEFNDFDELQELENFFMSGSCVRTQERDGDMPGAGHCQLTITLDTGATMNFGGEAFDGWDNLMAIEGGSQELIGLSGTVTLIGLNDNFEDTSDDFFSVPWIYGEAVLVYSICPQGYWDRYYIEDHDALPPPSIPNPFERQAEAVEVYIATPVDDDSYDY